MKYTTKNEMEKKETSDEGNVTKKAQCNTVEGLKENWQKWANDHCEYQKHNPFSSNRTMTVQFQKGEEGYGTPREGSRTQQRGQSAHAHIEKEVDELCMIIKSIGETGEDGKPRVAFGPLFERYVTISNKLVGVLLTARKHGRISFEGEMLWQRRDDDVIITVLE
ncbi:actin-binding Rho-activating protein-like [Huso huso]|nr:actin-binding Rho-activating protein-like [Acipenser ruthenus]XP_058880597.1 actin-binding Rho-activating protein-like [Acipenser ruthenus]